MAAVNPGERTVVGVQTVLLLLLYLFLYFPILYIAYLSLMENSVWPFPPVFTWDWYARLAIMSDFHVGLWNSFVIGVGTALLSALFATAAAIGVLRYALKRRGLVVGVYLAPLFVAQVLIGISTLMFNRNVLGIPGNIESAVVANTTYSLSFAFLVILAQLVRYDWRLDEVAQVFGARPLRCFREVTFPNVWPAMLGAFLVSFILGFNNFEITFYNVAAVPTLPTIAWGTLRHGIEPELYALASIVNALVFILLFVIYMLIRLGALRLGIPED
jgi:ABC-type spermidine/putrescine transport system permease subunit II